MTRPNHQTDFDDNSNSSPAAVTPLVDNEDSVRPSESNEESLTDSRFLETISPKGFQRDLLLLSHASFCKSGRRCQVNSSCVPLKSLWKHVSSCKQRECEICECPKYAINKSILNHYRNCQDTRCGYCGPVREIASSPDEWSNKHRRTKIVKFLVQDTDNSCRPASHATDPSKGSSLVRRPARGRIINSFTSSTRLLNHYSSLSDEPRKMTHTEKKGLAIRQCRSLVPSKVHLKSPSTSPSKGPSKGVNGLSKQVKQQENFLGIQPVPIVIKA